MFLQWFPVESEWVRIIYLMLYVLEPFPETFLPLGTPALTSRGFVEEDFAKVAEYFDKAVKLALKVKSEAQGWFISLIQMILYGFQFI